MTIQPLSAAIPVSSGCLGRHSAGGWWFPNRLRSGIQKHEVDLVYGSGLKRVAAATVDRSLNLVMGSFTERAPTAVDSLVISKLP